MKALIEKIRNWLKSESALLTTIFISGITVGIVIGVVIMLLL